MTAAAFHPPPGGRTVDALGVPIAVGPGLGATVRHLRSTDAAPVGTVGDTGVDPVRELTHLAVSHTDAVTFHAGVVGGTSGAIAFPATSGAGKSTLVAACVAAGSTYVCDEVLAVDPVTRDVVPFPRPLALSADSRALVGVPDDDEDERFVDPAVLGAVQDRRLRLRHVVVPVRVGGQPTLHRLDRADGVGRLLERGFNHFRFPAVAWATVTALAGEAEVWEARYADARALAELLVPLTSG